MLETKWPWNETTGYRFINTHCLNPNQAIKNCLFFRGGVCMPYHGKVCSNSLNTTLHAYRTTPRFFDNKFGLLGTEKFLLMVTKVINDFVTEDEKVPIHFA